MANEIKALTINGQRRTIKDETARNAAAAAQTTANAKQNALTFDSAPTAGSGNPVTSDGINTAIQSVSYTLPTASTSQLGGVKVDGETITIDANGVISAQGGGGGGVEIYGTDPIGVEETSDGYRVYLNYMQYGSLLAYDNGLKVDFYGLTYALAHGEYEDSSSSVVPQGLEVVPKESGSSYKKLAVKVDGTTIKINANGELYVDPTAL